MPTVPTGRRRGPGSSAGLTAEKEHVMSAAKELRVKLSPASLRTRASLILASARVWGPRDGDGA